MPDSRDVDRYLSRTERPELIDTAAKVAGFNLGKRPEFATAANVSGVRNRTFTFSQRRDSRTMFAADARYGVVGTSGAWRGADRVLVAACRRVLRAAGVPTKEVAELEVVCETGAVGEWVDGKVRLEEPELLCKIAAARRGLEGLSVWSSYAKVGLTDEGELGWLELHWPVISPEVLKEGLVLRSLVGRGFEPPEMPGARPQTVEAGILHSPAIGFLMDVTAAVRVVYEPDDPEMGRLATMYVDRHGDQVSLPRDIRFAVPDEGARQGPGSLDGND